MPRLSPLDWLERLTGPDGRERKKAVARVCQLAATDDDYRAVLRDALAQPNDRAVFWIVSDLQYLGPVARFAVPELIGLLHRRPLFGIRQAILGAIAVIAPDSADVKDAILEGFSDPDPSVRSSALSAAGKLPGLLSEDMDRIKAMGADPDRDVAFWSEVVLRNIAASNNFVTPISSAVDQKK
ncbi:HEAT repeat domain-containing protein [Limnoglobus roseus]|uniref:HEAT repeat domain-containing protein n=1 Tax=Limnoglobus roseus TaxID=2598579 RepID=A0A5C1AK70_9BACT|nr:hypothetical protein [Limnoglobus roseus]QEL19065.1 hypothetical protein PX52LOC_06122 [Limnoglobus roseus]